MKVYSKRFYKNQKISSIRSAKEILPLVLKLIKPNNVIDIGCGIGTWLYVLQKNGIDDIFGVDGPWIDKKTLLIPKNKFLAFDLKKTLKTKKKYDLVISLEVAEHIPVKYTKNYIKSLVNHGPIILFSAAIPLQGGSQHINGQWPSYWVELFEKEGYVIIDCLRKKIWNNKKIDFWYIQNIFLFVQKNHLRKNRQLLSEYKKNDLSQISVVHPEAYLYVAKKLYFFTRFIPLTWKRTLGIFFDLINNRKIMKAKRY